MENNNQQAQPQQTYQQTYQQPAQAQQVYQAPYDPNYAATAKEFLTKAIVACAISTIPVGSIISIFMGTNNRKNILEYIDRGGFHTVKIKVCSALSRAAKYGGIGMTIFWGIWSLYMFLAKA